MRIPQRSAAPMSDLSRVLHVATDREYEEILRSVTEKLVVVDFHATWSGPCLAMSKVYQKFSREYLNCIFLKVDVTDHTKTANDCGLRVVCHIHLEEDAIQ